jgi:hypothetical protein
MLMNKLKPKMLWPAAILVLAAALVLFSRPAGATVWTVTSPNDSGPDSLRGMIASAVPGDTIDFAGNVGTIVLASELPIDKNLTISGPGADKLTISGNNAVRVFRVTSSATLNMENLTVADGISDMGGGLYVEYGSATLSNCTLSNNSATYEGGGLYNFGTATLTNCTLSNNSATYEGGGLYNFGTATLTNCTLSNNSSKYGGGLYNLGTAILTNCTLSINSADLGGGLDNLFIATLTNCTVVSNSATNGGGLANSGTATLTNCTLSNNSANYGGGLNNDGTATLTNCTVVSNSAPNGGGLFHSLDWALTTVKSSIVANNSGGNCSTEGRAIDGGYNIDSGANCGFSSTRSNTDPLLALLADNGGSTQTCALGPGSPAINAIPVGTNGCGTTITTDQRGEPRPNSNWCDIGAFETLPNTTTTVTTSPNPSVYGQSMLVTAAVTGNSPTGTVAFRLDGGTISGCDAVPLASGQANCPASGLSVGAHAVSATYSGDTSNHSSIGSLSQQVNRADTTTTVTQHIPAPSVVGESVSVGFSVAAKAPGSGTPTGSVTVSNGFASCTATVAAGSCSLPFEDNFGTKTLVATYVGDTKFTGSQSAGVSHTVNLGSAVVTLSPAALDAGSLAVGSTGAAQHVTLTNTGSAALEITTIPATAGDFTVTHNCPATLNVGDSCAIGVTFRPIAAGARTATLEIVDSAGIRSVALAGTGTIAASSIVIDSVTPTTLYAGLDGAGVYRSSDSGANWSPATTQPDNKRIKALVIKPGDSAKQFAATYGGGVFKSSDGGDNWSDCTTQPTNLNLLSMTINATGKLYAGTEGGVFVSTDNCTTWNALNTGLPN